MLIFSFFYVFCFFFKFSIPSQRLPFRRSRPCPGCGRVSALPAQTLLRDIAYTHLHSGTQIACCCSRWLGKWLQKSSTVCDDAAMIRCYFFVFHHPSFWLLHQSDVSLKHLLFVVGIVKLAVCSRLVLQSL